MTVVMNAITNPKLSDFNCYKHAIKATVPSLGPDGIESPDNLVANSIPNAIILLQLIYPPL